MVNVTVDMAGELLVNDSYTTIFSNGSGNLTEFLVDFPNPLNVLYIRAIFITLYAVVFCMCFVGNSMVLFAIARCKRLRSMTNFFLANLAVADFCVGTFCVLPNLCIFIFTNWVLGRVMCKIYSFVWSFSYAASVFILTVIAIERYIVIIHPLQTRKLITNRNLRISQALIWILSAAYSAPYLHFYDTISPTGSIEYCFYKDEVLIPMKNFALVNFVVWYLLPLFLIGYMYGKVSCALWKTTVTDAMRLHRSADREESFRSCTSQSSVIDRLKTSTAGENKERADSESDPTSSNERALLRYPDVCNTGEQCGRTYSRIAAHVNFYKNGHVVQVGSDNDQSPAIQITIVANGGGPRASHDQLQVSSTEHREARYRRAHLASTKRVVKARRRVIRLLMTVVIVFAICVLPHHIRELSFYWFNFKIPDDISASLVPVSFAVLYLNSALNPILYALFSKNFRRSFKESLSFKCFKRRQETIRQ